MSERIAEDDPRYALKHAKKVGAGWYWLSLLLIISVPTTMIVAILEGEFSLWPAAFLVGLFFALARIGKGLNSNGYVHSKKRKTDGKEDR